VVDGATAARVREYRVQATAGGTPDGGRGVSGEHRLKSVPPRRLVNNKTPSPWVLCKRSFQRQIKSFVLAHFYKCSF
jgi:hypothetical protein